MGRMKDLMILEQEWEELHGGPDVDWDATPDAPSELRPWQKFQAGQFGTTDKRSRLELCNVSHVTHLPHAIRIIEDKKMRADLVSDKSKLNAWRTRVVWLSPNDWKNGFRYGNIRFQVSWGKLVLGKRYYWLEDIAYSTPACRILISDKDYSPHFEPYDPEKDDGPWILNGGQHFWNGKYCLEVMVDGDVPFQDVERVDFVDHHPKMCGLRVPDCGYRATDATDAGAEFIATLVSRGWSLVLPGFVRESHGARVPGLHVYLAIERLRKYYKELMCDSWGTLRAEHPTAASFVRAALSVTTEVDCANLISVFADFQNFSKALDVLLANELGIASPDLLCDSRIWTP